MNKTELIDQVAKVTDLKKKEVTQVVDVLLATIKEALRAQEKVQLVGFGNFEVRSRPARKGRNPQTGETIQIAASLVPSFRAGKQLKEEVNQAAMANTEMAASDQDPAPEED